MTSTKPTQRQLSLLVFLTACALYAPTLRYGFVLDDLALIVNNPLLKSWTSFPRLLVTGYWEAALGPLSRVQEFRPLTAVSFFLQSRIWGDTPWPYHLINVLLHAGVCALLFNVLRRGAGTASALAAALAFAALPVHVDAVANVAGRPELLALLGMLGAWEFLGAQTVSERGETFGLVCFAGALLSRENAVLFPIAYAGADWFANGFHPWDAPRRRIHGALWTLTLAYFALRLIILGGLFQGGVPYFADVHFGFKVLTLARFWFLHYAVPTLTGAWQRTDFSKPLIPLATLLDPVALGAAMALVAGADLAVNDLVQLRAGWAFWSLFAALFLLPTSHLLFPLDTIGAERFLYVPSLAWCAAVGWAAGRKVRGVPLWPAAAVLLLWYGGRTLKRESIWKDPLTYYSNAAQENPAAAGPRYSLGTIEAQNGQTAQARADFLEAIRLAPDEAAPCYDLGRLEYDSGDLPDAEAWLRKAAQKAPEDADTLVFLGLVADKQKNPQEAAQWLKGAVTKKPSDPGARFSLGRILLESGRVQEARVQWLEFLRLAPNDPKAPEVRRRLDQAPNP